jgi:lipid A ethanolaminephosphotransferase
LIPGKAGVVRPALTLLAALWLVVLGNFPFWRSVWRAAGGAHEGNLLFLLSLPLTVIAWTFLLLSLLAWGRATKPFLCAALLVSAAVGYFMQTYGVMLDAAMIASVAQTHAAEALELSSWRLWGWVAAFGVIPAVLIARARVTALHWRHEVATQVLGMAVAAACLVAVLLAHNQHYSSLLRNHRDLRLLLVPFNVVGAVRGYARQHLASSPRAPLERVGIDAARPRPAALGGKLTLTVLIVGETARAANFSLNGYARPTNPELARHGVLSFSDVSSCGTSTAVSLPCMFADVGREGFDGSRASRREGLLDVLQRAGIAVSWRDNNSGCKGVCDRVPHEDLSGLQVPGLCRDGECYDEILLYGLQAYLDGLDRDAVIVLHMKGSHGPAYFKRYPPEFEFFTPACSRVDLDRCPRGDIVNAYDNTLRYTDHVLGRTIDLLGRNAARFDTVMLYVSDHGESLGEGGLYLHGIPYALAPREQTHVPMLLWLSEGLRQRLDIDVDCLKARQQLPLSHDHVFHSMLGLSNVRTTLYRRERDLSRSCRERAG